MRLLVTGANGLLGLNLSLEALGAHTVIGVDRGELVSPPFEILQMDLTTEGSIDLALRTSRPDAVIHCAAIADVDACERDPALASQINAALPGKLALACRQNGLRLLHVSTDAVFDGKSPTPYSEDDEPHPIGVYAETKLEGERAVLELYPEAIVARVNFYGWSATGTRSLAEFFVNSLQAGRPVRGFTDVVFCPMLVNHLASLLVAMANSGLQGLFHAVGAEAMTKYEFGLAIARKFGLDDRLIEPGSVDQGGLAAKRSHNLHLSVHKLCTALRGTYPDFSTGMDRFYTQYEQGYPQRIRLYQQGKAIPTTSTTGAPASRFSAG